MWRLGALLAVAAIVLVAGCFGGEEDSDDTGAPRARDGAPATTNPAEATTNARCDVGGRPDYYVPKPVDSPLATIGCATLGVSSKPVEFSANSQPIGGKDYVCLNPAYRGRGRRAFYIPNACMREPLSRRLDVVSVEVPDQGVRGYQLVIWGTSAPSTREVVAGYKGGETQAAVFAVRPRLARTVGATRPFSVFVVELTREVDCRRVVLRADNALPPSTTRACD